MKPIKNPLKISENVRNVFTLGARGLSCAVSGLGECLYCDPRARRSLVGLRPTSAVRSRSGPQETSGTQGTTLLIQRSKIFGSSSAIFGYFRKSSEVFCNLRQSSEVFR